MSPKPLDVQGQPAHVVLSLIGQHWFEKKIWASIIVDLPSDHPNNAAMSCKIWNFFGSDLSRARKCSKWFVTICLDSSS